MRNLVANMALHTQMPTSSTTASSAVALSARSEEFRRVEYLLKLSLGSGSFGPTVGNVQIWHFDNPQHAAKFEIHNQDSPVIHAWLLEEEACEELVRNHGALPSFPLKFETGAIKMGEDGVAASATRGNKDVKRLVLCQIAVGRSFVQDFAAADGEEEDLARMADGKGYPRRPPEGFDSILQSGSFASNNTMGEDIYHHEYILFNSYQCLPLYLVQYETGSRARQQKLRGREENMYDKYDFFDPVYYVPVSIRDKMVGSHSKGEAANHKLISLQDAYEIALKESEKPDLLLRQTMQELKNQLRTVDGKLRDVNANSAKVEEQLYKCLQDALFELQQLTQSRMQALLSVEVELKRKLSHLEWAEHYLDTQRMEATPLDFLTMWKCHSQLRGDICHAEKQQQEATAWELAQIRADLEFVGSIHVRSAGDSGGGGQGRRRPLALMPGGGGTQLPSSRRGSGSMVISSPSHSRLDDGEGDGDAPPLFLEDTSLGGHNHPPPPSQAQPAAPSAGGTSILPEPNLDVSKAFIEALRQQSRVRSDVYGDKRKYGGGDGSVNSFLLQHEEVPPSPPPIYKRSTAVAAAAAAPPRRNAQFSIYEEACRKIRQTYKGKEEQIVSWLRDNAKFKDSRLLSQALPAQEELAAGPPNHYFALSQAAQLFLILPNVKMGVEPKLLYSSLLVGTPRLSDMVNTLPRQERREVNEAGEEIVSEILDYCPTVVLIRANGGKLFGGYVAESFKLTSGTFGTSRCFLFSLDNDLKIPFVGRETLPANKQVVDHFLANNLQPPKFATMFCDETKLQFGVGDLVLGYDLKQGASELEHSFGGVGLTGDQPRTILGGNERFNCEAIEFWALV